MTTPKTSSSKTASLTARHLDVRLRKIRSLKTSALKPHKIVPAAKILGPKPSIKSIVPYGLVIAALALSSATASEAHAATTHAKTTRPAHVVTHVARRHAVPAQQIDPIGQFFQGLFGGPPVVRTARSRAEQGGYEQWAWPTYNASTSSETAIRQSAEDEFRAEQSNEAALQQQLQVIDESNAASAATAAAGAQAAQDSVNIFQTEINANNGN